MIGTEDLRIYVVDDEPSLAEMVVHILQFRGYKATVFNDPTAALEQITTSPLKPHLLITDYLMGPMSGLELIARYKALVPPGKTLLVSGTVTPELLIAAATAPDQFLPKPYRADELLDKVDQLVQSLD